MEVLGDRQGGFDELLGDAPGQRLLDDPHHHDEQHVPVRVQVRRPGHALAHARRAPQRAQQAGQGLTSLLEKEVKRTRTFVFRSI